MSEENISILTSQSNAWLSVSKYVENEKSFSDIYNKVKGECIENGCYGSATIMKLFIDKLYELYKDAEDYLDEPLEHKDVVYNGAIHKVIYKDSECIVLCNPTDKNRILVTKDYSHLISKLSIEQERFINATENLHVSQLIKDMFWDALKEHIKS